MLDSVQSLMSEVTPVIVVSIIASLLQACGYGFYIFKTLRKEVDPNPTTWLMFAYGTGLLTWLEWDSKADWWLLALPATCAALAILVSVICFIKILVRRIKRQPVDLKLGRVDYISFGIDASLTFIYFSASVLMMAGYVSTEQKVLLTLVVLVCTNLSTIISFGPLMNGAYHKPEKEHPHPWMIWAVAYATLGLATVMDGKVMSELMLYPALNMVLHGSVAFIVIFNLPLKKFFQAVTHLVRPSFGRTTLLH